MNSPVGWAHRAHAEILAEWRAECDNFFIWQVVSARAALSPKYPQTLHYTGDGVFMVAGKIISRRRQFLPEML